MNVLIIYCHPSRESYTYQILDQLKSTLKKENIEFKVSDLYEMNFQSDMTGEEYQREGLLCLDIPISPDVLEEHKKINQADCIIFLYPVWWSDCPAKLKGWFDRVYSVGYAYGHQHKRNTAEQMKTVPYGVVVCTAGHPNTFLKEIGIAESMRNVMIDDRLGQRFREKEMIILGGTLELEKVKAQHSQLIIDLGKQLKERSTEFKGS